MKRPTRNIKSATERATLPVRREPYWHPLYKGLAVGYRVSKTFGEGIWQARWRDPDTGKHLTTSLGHFSDVYGANANHAKVKAFDEASKAAIAWADDMRAGITNTQPTVADACKHYVNAGLAGRPKAQQSASGSFRYRIEANPIAKIKLSSLRKSHLRDWMLGSVQQTVDKTGADPSDPDVMRRAKDTANRDFRHLRAALNLACSDGMCSNSLQSAWSTGIAFPGTNRSKGNYLNDSQTSVWIDATPQPLRNFLYGLMLTAARPGELATLKVQDFDKAAGILTVATGKRKEGREKIFRNVVLTTDASNFISKQCTTKLKSAYLFHDSAGNPWNKQTWQECGKYAIQAGLPEGTSAYDMRHATISRWLAGGLSTFEAAKLAGTSEDMIQRHYGHLLAGVTKIKLDSASLSTKGH